MKRPTVFITYFQSSAQFVDIYQVLLSEYFCQKNGACLNLILIFPNFQLYDFIRILLKVANLYFLQSSQECLQMCQESIFQNNPVGNKSYLKILKSLKHVFFADVFFKTRNFEIPTFHEMKFKIWTKACFIRKIRISYKHVSQVTTKQSHNFFQNLYFFLS